MAVDTKAKRFSMLNFGSISTDLLPAPDGTIDQADRQHLLDLYGGILAAGAAVLGPYCVLAAEVFVAGVIDKRAEVFVAGAGVGEAFSAGAVLGEVCS